MIELLSPAKNIDCGLAAINHGADAVYIGASKFGARSAAGNSINDLEHLAAYAHRFNARVYATINTILADSDLDEAQSLIWQLYHAGIDAVIIQDMGILQLDLPPIALHASTQTDNRTLEKVQFLQQVGFSQVVLARELSLEQIRHIASQTTVPLEFFVHGALCVSYSGQCYLSEALCRRSANKGECAQSCRLPYQLVDARGSVLKKDKHLLSLKDMNLSAHLEQLMEAGVASFKIEGRLKDADYVKNITAFYRQKIDNIIEGNARYKKSSSGKTTFFFSPNPQKSFNRGSTSYFLEKRKEDISSFDTPKSVGERLGEITQLAPNYLRINTKLKINNGDGLFFISSKGEFTGFRVNRVEGDKLFFFEKPSLALGTEIFRNFDTEYDHLLSRKSAERKISVAIVFSETQSGFAIQLTDEDGNQLSHTFDCSKEPALQKEKALDNIRQQLAKLGNTDFVASEIELQTVEAYFIPASILSEQRRRAIEQLEYLRRENYTFHRKEIKATTHPFPQKQLNYRGNVHNEKAKQFYLQHGVESVEQSFEAKHPSDVPLMFCRHCIKFSLNACPKYSKKPLEKLSEPLFLQYKEETLRLHFDCSNCEMQVIR